MCPLSVYMNTWSITFITVYSWLQLLRLLADDTLSAHEVQLLRLTNDGNCKNSNHNYIFFFLVVSEATTTIFLLASHNRVQNDPLGISAVKKHCQRCSAGLDQSRRTFTSSLSLSVWNISCWSRAAHWDVFYKLTRTVWLREISIK